MFSAGLGHEAPAMLALVTAFLGGMALGAWALDGRIHRSPDSRRWYGRLQLCIGAWAGMVTLLVPQLNRLAIAVMGADASPLRQALVAFAIPFLALLPATAAMGATLPAMERWFASVTAQERALARVYAWNTAGAAAGTLATAFLLAPAMGFRASALLLCGLNLVCGALAWNCSPAPAHDPGRADLPVGLDAGQRVPTGLKAPIHDLEMEEATPKLARSAAQLAPTFSQTRLLLTAFVTGSLGIGFEIIGVRVLSQALENTHYTFAAALAVYLLGTALGAAGYQRLRQTPPFRPILARLLCALAAVCLAEMWVMTHVPSFYDALRGSLGDQPLAVAVSEFTVALAVFLLPTLLMGATFSHLVAAAKTRDRGVGRAAAANTLGGALAGAVFGLAALPALGAKWSLIALTAGYLVVLPTLSRWNVLGVALCGGLVFALPADLRLVRLPPDAKLRAWRQGVMGSVAVIETPDGNRSLRVNNRFQMGGTAAALAQRRQAHLPLLLHPAPRRALFLGPGTGITLGAATEHPGLAADGVELVPEIVELMHYFEPENKGVGNHYRSSRRKEAQSNDEQSLLTSAATVIIADARRYVRATDRRYDVIVADLFHPGQDGAGFLYTREHFEAVRQRLAPGGLFCQWLPLHQLDEFTLRVIVRTFLDTFSHTHAFLLHFNADIPVLGFVGTLEPLTLPPDWLERRLGDESLRARMKEVGFDRTLALLGCHVAGPETLAAFAGTAPLNTDNFPRVAFAAPRFTARRDTRPADLLLAFLARCATDSRSFLPPDASGFRPRLADYVVARDLYLRGLATEAGGKLSEAIEAYLESTRRSLYFTPAYARLVNIIQVMAAVDRAGAKRLFERLQEAQPGQPLGQQLLGPLLKVE
jgi:spermidine synthase